MMRAHAIRAVLVVLVRIPLIVLLTFLIGVCVWIFVFV